MLKRREYKILYWDESEGQDYLYKKIVEKICEKTGFLKDFLTEEIMKEIMDTFIKEGYIQMGIKINSTEARFKIEIEPLVTEKGITYFNLDKNRLTKGKSKKWGVIAFDQWVKFRQFAKISSILARWKLKR